MKKLILVFIAALYSTIVFCQGKEKIEVGVEDGKITVEKTEAWYASPWVWVIGAFVFILLLVALTRKGRRD